MIQKLKMFAAAAFAFAAMLAAQPSAAEISNPAMDGTVEASRGGIAGRHGGSGQLFLDVADLKRGPAVLDPAATCMNGARKRRHEAYNPAQPTELRLHPDAERWLRTRLSKAGAGLGTQPYSMLDEVLNAVNLQPEESGNVRWANGRLRIETEGSRCAAPVSRRVILYDESQHPVLDEDFVPGTDGLYRPTNLSLLVANGDKTQAVRSGEADPLAAFADEKQSAIDTLQAKLEEAGAKSSTAKAAAEAAIGAFNASLAGWLGGKKGSDIQCAGSFLLPDGTGVSYRAGWPMPFPQNRKLALANALAGSAPSGPDEMIVSAAAQLPAAVQAPGETAPPAARASVRLKVEAFNGVIAAVSDAVADAGGRVSCVPGGPAAQPGQGLPDAFAMTYGELLKAKKISKAAAETIQTARPAEQEAAPSPAVPQVGPSLDDDGVGFTPPPKAAPAPAAAPVSPKPEPKAAPAAQAAPQDSLLDKP